MPIATVPGGSFSDVGVLNVNQAGDETLEVWLRPYVGVAGSSGVPQEVSPGVWVGAGDFSEFALQGAAALPAGLTLYAGGGAANHEILNSDTPPAAKRIWRRNESTDNTYVIGYDAFDDLWQYGGEILARVWVSGVTGSGIRHKWGFGIFSDIVGVVDDKIGLEGHAFSNSFRWAFGQSIAAASTFAALSTQINDGDPSGGFAPFWAWMRMRLDDAGGGNTRVRAHSSYSLDFENPPAVPGVWDLDETVAVSDQTAGVGSHLGFFRHVYGPLQGSDRQWSFLGFTSDYSVQVAPGNVSEVGGSAPGAWVLAKSVAVAAVDDQVVRVEGLDPGTLHDVALRYRRGLKYNPGAENTADPTVWPSVSRGQFTTTVDPPTFVSGVWSRTSAIAEQILLTVTPLVGEEALDINVYREKVGEGSPTLIGVIAGPHVGNATFIDSTILGESRYLYSFATVGLTAVGAQTSQVEIWSGPAGQPVFSFQTVFGAGYLAGFVQPTDTAQGIELDDAYDNLGGVQALTLRATLDPIGGALEVFSGVLANVPAPDFTFGARLRFKQTAFTVADFSQYSVGFDITVPLSE